MAEAEVKKNPRRIKGTVVSDKMDKTIVVLVETLKTHPIYKKRFKRSKKYKVHDENEIAKIGDIVIAEETRPISKEKHYKLISVEKTSVEE